MKRDQRARVQRVLVLSAVLAATGCVSVQAPPDDLATRHVGAPAQFAEAAMTPINETDQITTGWLAHFDDPVLEGLVRESWAHNPDLYVAAARFEEAAASLRIAGSQLWPDVNAAGGASYTNTDGSADRDSYSVGAGISWEIDLWGRLRSDRQAARRIGEAAGLEYVQARHSLASSVARAYYAVIAAKEQLAIDQMLLDAESFTAVTTRQRVEAGLGTNLDLDLAESSVALAEAAVANDQAALREARRAIELLVGRYPAAELESATPLLPRIEPGALAIGVPTSLLERRPDVRSAELRVDAAYYSVKSANAARLPALTLRADATQFFDPSEFVTTVAGDVLAPLFQGGRLRAREEIANARQRQALGQFAAVALRAFGEVESALSNERHLHSRVSKLVLASDGLTRAGEAAINRYEQGLLTILELQQIRRSDFSTRSLLLSVRYELISQRLDLYLALGGPVLDDAQDGVDAQTQSELLEQRPSDSESGALSGALQVGIKPASQQESGTGPEENDGD